MAPLKCQQNLAQVVNNGMADPAEVEGLLKELGDDDSAVRMNAACALADDDHYNLPAFAVAPLIAALNDDDERVRESAAGALRQIGDPRAIPALIEALNDRLIASNAALALGNIRDPAAVPALIKALRDDSHHVPFQAAQALDRIRSGNRDGGDDDDDDDNS